MDICEAFVTFSVVGDSGVDVVDMLVDASVADFSAADVDSGGVVVFSTIKVSVAHFSASDANVVDADFVIYVIFLPLSFQIVLHLSFYCSSYLYLFNFKHMFCL